MTIEARLEDIRVASPCTASWAAMKGDDRVRHCEKCALHVYSLSGMTRSEATELVTRAEGRLCIRYFRRRDGTILTADCPIGVRAAVRRARLLGAALGVAFLCAIGLNAMIGGQKQRTESGFTDHVVALWYEVLDALPVWMVPASWRRQSVLDLDGFGMMMELSTIPIANSSPEPKEQTTASTK